MKKKVLCAYIVLLVLLFSVHALKIRTLDYIVPLYLVGVTLILKKRIRMDISANQLIFALVVSAAVLLPYYFLAAPQRRFIPPGIGAATFQLLAVSLPEEIFFRGLLQEVLGNTVIGMTAVSLLFAIAHLPAFFYYGDVSALLTFFPSLVMGFLYMRSGSVLPPAIFHFLSNILYQGTL